MKNYFLAALLLVSLSAYSQSVDEIKKDNSYLFGEGYGETLQEADNAALRDLVSQISVDVKGSFTTNEKEIQSNGDFSSSTEYQSVISTYSQATLTNTKRIIISNDPDARVLRFVRKEEVNRIFESRRAKVLDFVESAQKAELKGQIDVALRYYYWAYCLLRSLQHHNEVLFDDNEGQKRVLANWIPEKMNEIFSNVSVCKESVNGNIVYIYVTYKEQPAGAIDYTYFDGQDWSNIYSAKDGKGVVELMPGAMTDNIRIKCEFEYAGESHMDKEVATVMNVIKPTNFRKSYVNVTDLKNNSYDASTIAMTQSVKQQTNNTYQLSQSNNNINNSFLNVDHTELHTKVMSDVIMAIKDKKYSSARPYFSDNGWESFRKLVQYGDARIIDNQNLSFVSLGDKVTCRGVSMMFSFRNNTRKFTENVNFIFSSDSLIDKLTFALSSQAVDDLLNKDFWKIESRLILMNFLEEYKTAFALKDLDFVQQVFDDNAVIITGVVSRRPQATDRVQFNVSKNMITYTRKTKAEYLNSLSHSFRSNEYINIRFADNNVMKAGVGGELYGIQIKQDYVSSNYGDSGYLFLMVDINNPEQPIIKVRSWQPEKDPDFGLIGIADF